MAEQYEEILSYWFGRVEETIVPSEERSRVWFGDAPDIDETIRNAFSGVLNDAAAGLHDQWIDVPRGQLGLVLLYDQFARHIYRGQPQAYQFDDQALDIVLDGIANEDDHELSLIERVFYYFPLLHSEQLRYQEAGIRAYEVLTELAFSETHAIYDSFLKFARHHHMLISRFGRFPQRNRVLSRDSSKEELDYLESLGLLE